MKKYIVSAAAISALIVGVTLFADDDDDRYEKQSYVTAPSKAVPVNSETLKLYKNECGSCHMAYQPEFLPKRSWVKMMNTLEDHFKTDATLEAKDHKMILEYLTSNAGDVKYATKHFSRMANSVAKEEAPLRISQTPYFMREHRKIPKRFIEQKEVKSIANCNACHTTAEQGSYSERAIKIPNYGRWDD